MSDVIIINSDTRLACNFCGTVIPHGWQHSCTADEMKRRIAILESRADTDLFAINELTAQLSTAQAENRTMKEALEAISTNRLPYDEDGYEIDLDELARAALAGIEKERKE